MERFQIDRGNSGNRRSRGECGRGFAGLRVVSFESRRAVEIQRLIENKGGAATLVPSMQEVRHKDQPEVPEFARRLLGGELDMVLFMTGIGTRMLAQEMENYASRPQWLPALVRTVTVARGPKPVAALREIGAPVTLRVPAPHTWRELLAMLDNRHLTPVAGRTVALQEYGMSNEALIEGLKERGATVLSVPIYHWALPGDTQPLRNAVRDIIAGVFQISLFTSGTQVWHLFQIAEECNLAEALREALQRTVIVSIGPVCSESLREQGLEVDLESEHPRMGRMVREAAERSHELLALKQDLMFA